MYRSRMTDAIGQGPGTTISLELVNNRSDRQTIGVKPPPAIDMTEPYLCVYNWMSKSIFMKAVTI